MSGRSRRSRSISKLISTAVIGRARFRKEANKSENRPLLKSDLEIISDGVECYWLGYTGGGWGGLVWEEGVKGLQTHVRKKIQNFSEMHSKPWCVLMYRRYCASYTTLCSYRVFW